MNIEIGNNTVEMINGLGIKLEEYGVQLFQIALNQRDVFIIKYIFWLCVALSLFFITRQWYKTNKDNFDLEIGLNIYSVIFIILMIVLFFNVFILIISSGNLFQWVFNPEYAAIQELKYLLR